MSVPTWLHYVQAVSYLAAGLSALIAVFTYRRNSRQERAVWLFELYQRFYDSPSHAHMRRLVESGKTKFAETEDDEELLQKLDDYLNFFEFITFLVHQGRLKRKEALAMFDYPLRLIAKDKALMRYLSRPEYGYEGLTEFVKELGYS